MRERVGPWTGRQHAMRRLHARRRGGRGQESRSTRADAERPSTAASSRGQARGVPEARAACEERECGCRADSRGEIKGATRVEGNAGVRPRRGEQGSAGRARDEASLRGPRNASRGVRVDRSPGQTLTFECCFVARDGRAQMLDERSDRLCFPFRLGEGGGAPSRLTTRSADCA